MPIRIDCTTPGLEDCYIEVSERWTRGDVEAIFRPADFPAVWRRRVVGCVLARADGDPLTDPAVVVEADGKLHPDLDWRLRLFPEAAMVVAVDQLARLGKANARLSSGGSGRAETTMLPETTTATNQA